MKYYPSYYDYKQISNDENVKYLHGTFIVNEIYRDGSVLLENNKKIEIKDGLQGINRAFHNNSVIIKVSCSENSGKIIYCKQEPILNIPGVLILNSQTIHGVTKKATYLSI